MRRIVPALILVHRYMGLAFCLVFLVWFASGIVMIFKRMPEFTAAERLARMPPLDPSAVRLTPQQAFDAAGLDGPPQRVVLTSFLTRPVYRFVFDAGSLSVYADDGAYADTVDSERAVRIAEAMFPDSRGRAVHVEARDTPDQWTIGNRFGATGALHRVALGDGSAAEIYVAEATGEVVMKTDRDSRFWGYMGPVAHWFYFTPLRAGQAPLWANVIVYGSMAACLLCVLGLAIGVYRFSVSRRYLRGTAASPYVGWLRWHHYAGLLFGVVTLTWTFSGLLTMTPWNLFPGGGPTRDQVRAIRGDGVAIERFTASPAEVLRMRQARFPPRELELVQFMGAPFYAAFQQPGASGRPHQDGARYAPGAARLVRVLVIAAGAPRIHPAFRRDELLAAARAAMPGYPPAEIAWLTDYDAYYYDRTGGRRLPGLRVKFDDPDRTWLYLDPADGSLVLAEVRGSRAERWLYQALHSLDVPGLYQTPWAWYTLIVGLSLGGLALSSTSVVVGWRVVRGRRRD